MCEHSVMHVYSNHLAHHFGKQHFWIITRNSLIHKGFKLSNRIIRTLSMEKTHETHHTIQSFSFLSNILFRNTHHLLHHQIVRVNPMSDSFKLFCNANLDGCELHVNPERAKHGYMTCIKCGHQLALKRKFTVACNNKQGYELINDPTLLKQLNPKRTI